MQPERSSNPSTMTGDTGDIPDLQTQQSTIAALTRKSLALGDTWYLIGNKWYRKWETYVSWSRTSHGDNPGPIDNSTLFTEAGGIRKLTKSLSDVYDYHVVPEEAWTKLSSWYGLVSDDHALPRSVIETGTYTKTSVIEVYLLEFKLCTNSDLTRIVTYELSRIARVAQVREKLKEILKVSENKETKLWCKNSTNTFEKITNDEDTIEEAGIYTGCTLVIEVQNEDGTWARPDNPTGSTFSTQPNSPPHTRSSATYNSLSSSSFSSSYSNRYEHRQQLYSKGVCGLHNLGNTCFMNSALQCMSNVEALTYYFSERKHKSEINTDNPLGMRGEIAKAYGELIQQMWSGRHQAVMPRDFKQAVGKFAPQFCGFQQHDSQELLAFLLDGLHEDLNRIKRKPYIEVKDANGRPDQDVAVEAWVSHKQRNDSIIVDMFHGLFKSTLVCPVCDKVSITFDPFCFLSLPMVVKKDRVIEFFFSSNESTSRPLQSCVNVSKQGKISHLCDAVAQMFNVSSKHLTVAEVHIGMNKLRKVFTNDESVDTIKDTDVIYIYELSPKISNEQLVAVCMRRPPKHHTNDYFRSSMDMFSTPFLVNVPRKISYQELYNIMLNKMSRFVRIPETNDWMEKDGSDEDSDFTNSNNIDVNGVATDNYNTDRNGDSMSESSSSPVINSQRKVRMFTLSRCSNSSMTDPRQIKDDSSPVEISSYSISYISIDWNAVALDQFYQADEAECVDKHSSHSLRSEPKKKPNLDLDNCIELFLQREKLGADDPWYCPKCKEHQRATKKFDLWSLPDMLVICLKRFRYNRYSRDKIDSAVHFPVRDLDMSKFVLGPGKEMYMYDLIAVSNHYGSLGGGHYTAYAKNHIDQQWYNFDDSRVTQASEEQVVSKAAYVLMYQRQGSKLKLDPVQTISSLAAMSTDNSHNRDVGATSTNGQSSSSDQDDNNMETN